VIFTPETVFPGVSPIVWPASTARLWEPAVTIGSGVDLRIGRHASVVLESSVIFTGQIVGRFSAGVVVPVGAYPTRPGVLAAAVPWRGLSEGDRAWVTRGGGQEVAGEVVRLSSTSLVLRTGAGVETFGPDDIAAIDTTDPIRNGTVRGAKIGAIGGAGQAVFVSLLLCAMEECDAQELVGVNATLVGIGTGVGAAIGALADSLRERREPLYRRRGAAAFTITPLLGKQALGVGGVIRW
jgi:hypothetical protein